MVDHPSTSHRELEEARRLLARTPMIRGACELDLLGFLYRHPRTLLTSEQMASLVGYHMKQVAKSLDAFIEAGLLGRTRNRMHAARMYSLVLKGQQGEELTALLKLASTSRGRREILDLLGSGKSRAVPIGIAS